MPPPIRRDGAAPSLALAAAVLAAFGGVYWYFSLHGGSRGEGYLPEYPASGAAPGPPPAAPGSAARARSGLDLLVGPPSQQETMGGISSAAADTTRPDGGETDRRVAERNRVEAELRAYLAGGSLGEPPPLEEEGRTPAGERTRLAEDERGLLQDRLGASLGAQSAKTEAGAAGEYASSAGALTSPVSILFGRFSPAERKRLLHSIEAGQRLVPACRSSGLAQKCASASQDCLRYPHCQRWLALQLGVADAAGPNAVIGGGSAAGGRGATDERFLATGSGGALQPGARSPAASAPKASSGSGGGSHNSGGSTGSATGTGTGTGAGTPTNTGTGTNTGTKTDTNCLAAGTRVLTPSGPRPIEELRPGDPVLAAAHPGRRRAATVLRVLRARAGSTLRLRFEDGRALRGTEAHPLFDPRAGAFRPLGEFQPGDSVEAIDDGAAQPASSDGRARGVEVVSVERLEATVEVFDITVDDSWAAFAAEGLLVHNKQPGPTPLPQPTPPPRKPTPYLLQ